MTERRRGPLRAGIAGLVVGAVLTIVAAVLLWSTQALQIATADDRARVGEATTFDADDSTYGLVLLTDLTGGDDFDGHVERLDCTVQHPDGATEVVNTRSGTTRLTTSLGTEIGSFEGRPGSTTVMCVWNDGRDPVGYFYSVGPAHEAANTAGTVLLLVGIAVLVGSVVPLVIGLRGRAVTVRN